MTLSDVAIAVIDLFRVENGKIVEHWAVMEEIRPEETWVNSGEFCAAPQRQSPWPPGHSQPGPAGLGFAA